MKYLFVITSISTIILLFPGCRVFSPSDLDTFQDSESFVPYSLNDQKKNLFDPHNHLNGILPPLAYANLAEYTQSFGTYQPTSQEILGLLAYLLSKYENPELFSSLPLGTKIAVACAKSRTKMGQATDREIKGFVNLLLTATPWTSFDSAYKLRDHAVDWVNKNELDKLKTKICPKTYVDAETCSYYAIAMATLIELMRNHIIDTEISIGAIGGISQGKLATMDLYQKIVQDLKQENYDQLPPFWKEIATQKDLQDPKPPTIRWLLMTHTTELAQAGADSATPSPTTFATTMEQDGRFIGCHARPQLLRSISQGSFLEKTHRLFHERKDLAGFDTAGPENTCFTGRGMTHYQSLLTHALQTSSSRRQINPKAPKIVVRTHVGEGFPALEFTGLNPEAQKKLQTAQSLSHLDDAALAQSCQGLLTIPQVQKNDFGTYAHYDQATKNIDAILQTIKLFLHTNPSALNLIQIRLGHVTHLTMAQAQWMSQLGLYADVNITSNISTGSFIIEDPGQKALPQLNQWVEKTEYFNSIKQNLGIAHISTHLRRHGLYHLIANGVPTMLGTDGGGVEHSHPFSEEFLLGEGLLVKWFPQEAQNFKSDQGYFIKSANQYQRDRLGL